MHHIKHSLETIANSLAEETSEDTLKKEIRQQQTTYNRLNKLVNLPIIAKLTRPKNLQREQELRKVHLTLYAHKAAHARKTGDEEAYKQFLKEANNYQNA